MPQISMRTALWLVLLGSVIFWAGIPWPANGDFFEAENDVARIAVVEEHRTAFAIAFSLLGVGALIAAVGLWSYGLHTAAHEGTHAPRRRVAAQVAAWLALAGVLSGTSRTLHALFGSAEANVTSDIDLVLGIAAAVATSIALVILGGLAWAGPPPRWTAVLLVLGGVLGAAMFLPFWWFGALLIFAITNLIVTRGGRAGEPSAAPTPASG